MLKRWTLVSVAVAILTVAALVPPSDAWAQQTLRIGELGGLTGGIAPYGVPMHNARKLTFEDINAKGGITVGGTRYKLELVTLDGGNPKEAVTVFERLLTVEKVNLVLDGAYSSVQYALGPVVKGKKALVVWSGGNDPATTVGVPNAFRNNFDGGGPLSRATERFLRTVGVKRVATYGQTGHSDFMRFVEDHLPKVKGIEIVATEWHPFGEKDFFPVLTKLKGLKPDAIITHGFYTDGLTMLKQAREIGLFPGTVWLAQYAASPQLMDEAGRKVWEGAYEILIARTSAGLVKGASAPGRKRPTTRSTSSPRRWRKPARWTTSPRSGRRCRR
jgi:branched-chain amino acid transport system substrate-binding protein